MDYGTAYREFCKRLKLPVNVFVREMEFIRMIREEAIEIQGHGRSQRKRLRFNKAIDEALDRMVEWTAKADEWSVSLKWDEIASFCGSHRLTTVWCIALGKYLRTPKGKALQKQCVENEKAQAS
jgi:hypothetical protein